MSFARMLMGVIVDVVGERDERSRANNAVASACVDCGAGGVIPRDRHSAGDARLESNIPVFFYIVILGRSLYIFKHFPQVKPSFQVYG